MRSRMGVVCDGRLVDAKSTTGGPERLLEHVLRAMEHREMSRKDWGAIWGLASLKGN